MKPDQKHKILDYYLNKSYLIKTNFKGVTAIDIIIRDLLEISKQDTEELSYKYFLLNANKRFNIILPISYLEYKVIIKEYKDSLDRFERLEELYNSESLLDLSDYPYKSTINPFKAILIKNNITNYKQLVDSFLSNKLYSISKISKKRITYLENLLYNV